ncbi:MAG: hypothetical protein HY036_06595 [Nitrospirae bacterium]|nr:hypothetical protein [Nitrospirota bacterium]MBI3352230.1 hypothetical protein [Nitrospirota bacterium]
MIWFLSFIQRKKGGYEEIPEAKAYIKIEPEEFIFEEELEEGTLPPVATQNPPVLAS